ncbi:MAG: glutamate--tRNA ligase [Hyphomicrobiales bacterium]|nr:glutamate--tRNA ligase [Hyphomicrobiales bacterium]
MTKPPTVRFAPSPTGHIHIGNARTALFNYLFARRNGGRFILRFDDTDRERSRDEYARSIETDLRWLGIEPDEIAYQSQRFALYDAAAQKLKDEGLLYPCYETPEELDRKRRRQTARGQPPVYDRAALQLSVEERAKLEAENRRPHWRFKLDQVRIDWDDMVRGPSHVDCASLSDPVLIREDGTYLYTLPSVTDDIDLGVTHVIRGEDHVTNTAVQIQLFEKLGGAGKAPVFGHHNLLAAASGEGLSKRSGALSIGGLRDHGQEALAVAAIAVLTGSSDAVRPVTSMEELRDLVDISHVSRSAARFDEDELSALTARTLHGLPFASVAPRLAETGIPDGGSEDFWLAVRGNLGKLSDAREWWDIIHASEPDGADPSDAGFLRQAAALLPDEPWDGGTWKIWTDAIKAETGAKGRALFHPLRLALTGREKGPELAALLPLIGRARALARLS